MSEFVLRSYLGYFFVVFPMLAMAGPPYVSDDPEPTDPSHYEIYFFDAGSGGSQGVSRARGIDFNYGARQDLQLTATAAFEEQRESGSARGTSDVSDVELAVKYRFLHQAEAGWDVAVFPTVVLPSHAREVGARHIALFLPVWVEKDWGQGWSTFGGGGCEWNHGGDSKNFCLAGWATTLQVRPSVQLGMEIVHQTSDTRQGHASTSVGAGLKYDFSNSLHFLAYTGSGLQNFAPNERYDWYMSVLLTL